MYRVSDDRSFTTFTLSEQCCHFLCSVKYSLENCWDHKTLLTYDLTIMILLVMILNLTIRDQLKKQHVLSICLELYSIQLVIYILMLCVSILLIEYLWQKIVSVITSVRKKKLNFFSKHMHFLNYIAYCQSYCCYSLANLTFNEEISDENTAFSFVQFDIGILHPTCNSKC